MQLTPEFLARVAAESGNAKIVADPSFRVAWVNRAFEDLTGWALREVEGRRPSEFLQGPDTDRDTVERIRQQLKRQEPVDAELLNYRRDGQPYWVSLRIRPMRDANGNLMAYHSTQQDITQRRANDAKLRDAMRRTQDVLDTVESVIVGLDVNGVITSLNRSGERALGVTEHEVVGTSWFERFVPDADRAKEFQRFRAIMEDVADEDATLERPVRIATGASRLMRWQVAYPRDADGQRRGALRAGVDITELRVLEREAGRRHRLEAIGTLAGGIAHDLNNALTPLMMGLESLEDGAPAAADLVRIMHASADRASSMVRQLVAFARGAEGDRQLVDVAAVTADIVALVTRTFAKSIVVTSAAAPHLPAVLGDATQIHQVLLNLCVNARDAMRGGGELHIAVNVWGPDAATRSVAGAPPTVVHGTQPSTTTVCIDIADTGTGIAPTVLDRIFEPFFTTKPVDEGTGLGLSNVLAIVKGHGGFVAVQTSAESGTTFRIGLPAASVVGPHADRSPGRARTLAGVRVVLAEDEAPIRELVTMSLAGLGAIVRAAPEVATALRLLEDGTADVLVTDLSMPGESGIVLLERVAARWPLLPVVVVSGHFDDVWRSVATKWPQATVLEKPFATAQLADAIVRARLRLEPPSRAPSS